MDRHNKERGLPNLRQEPSLPVSPPSDTTVGQFDGRKRDDAAPRDTDGHWRSKSKLVSDESLGKDWGRPPSGKVSKKGPAVDYENGDRSGGGEGPASRSEDERRTEGRERRESRGRKEKASVRTVEEERLNSISDQQKHLNRNKREMASASDATWSEKRMDSGAGLEERTDGLAGGRGAENQTDERDAERSGTRGTGIASRQTTERRRERANDRSEEESTERSNGGGSERRTERSAAEEEERRRRKEERRIKRAEKEARRATRAQRGEGESGEETTGRRQSGRETIRERIADGLPASQSGSGDRNERREDRGRDGTSKTDRSRERERNAERMLDSERMRRSGAGRRDDMNGSPSGPPVLGNGLPNDTGALETGSKGPVNGASGKGANGRLGRGVSFMNEVYEENDEAMLLHSTFKYDESTGQLTSTLASSMPAAEEKKQRLYIEGVTDGNFHRTHTGSEQGDVSLWCCWRPATWQRRDAEDDDVELGSSGGIVLRVACEQVAACLSFVAHFSNSLLGGFALLNLYLTYLYNAGSLPGGFLAYYTPVAINCQRTFLLLSSICLLAACDKYAKDKLAEWQPRGNVQWRHDLLVILSFFLAFVLSVVGTPFEVYIFQQNKSSPDWYSTDGSTAHFQARLKSWHVLNFVRLGACAVGFFVVMLEGNVALRTARNKSLQVARLERTAGAAALANSLARANVMTQSMQATRYSLRS
ncbi:hypothetical protein KFL_000200230 [Klebsormidium nitens]|uniref:Transmembrane protein n=1 Tax=Klebsormidium nitens TaxID=105231 RepID=A0A1Y1HPG5_KLENI|nr:hypothetical protein KFL_000200230 [Klebsormidium nitens]|eukprot:GAQ78871.1 hypothetical protein KFL_000200230 [Klebsormidium nitens]